MLRNGSELLNELVAFDEEPEENEPEAEFIAEDSGDEDDQPTALPFNNLEAPSGHRESLGNINRYRSLFKATIEALKDASIALVNKHGSVESLRAANAITPVSIHPRWVVTFMNGNPEVLTTNALEDVPLRTRSILGDPDLRSENWLAKLRELPKVPKNTRDFYAGEYIDIVDRLWHKTSPDGQYTAGQIETKSYKGGTSNQDKGARIRTHRRFLRMTIPEAKAAFTKKGNYLPYHYRFGCQPAPSKDGPAYQCRSDFRSLGHISDDTNASKAAWPWLRELVNQILLHMLPSYESSFRCVTLTDDTKQLVRDIRQKLEAEFGQLPNLSHVTLNRGCCLMEPPRGTRSVRKTCVKCPKPFTGFNHIKGVPWQDNFRLDEPGNSMGGVICDGCRAANPPPGHKFCRKCRHHVGLALFKGNNICGRCRRKERENARARADPKAKVPKLPVADADLENDLKNKWTEEDDKILRDGIAAGLYGVQIAAVSSHFLDLASRTNMRCRSSRISTLQM